MIDNLIRQFIPVMLTRVSAMPMEEKRRIAAHMIALLSAFLDGRKEEFTIILTGFGTPDAMQRSAIEALFRDENKTG